MVARPIWKAGAARSSYLYFSYLFFFKFGEYQDICLTW